MRLGRDHQKRNRFVFDRTPANPDLAARQYRPYGWPSAYAVREKRSDRTLPDAVSRERRELVDTADREFSGIS